MQLSSLRKLIFLLFFFLLTACNGEIVPPTGTAAPSESVDSTATSAAPPTISPTPEPTATPVPLAAVVNGEALTLAEFEAELARYTADQPQSGTNLATTPQQVVLDALVDEILLAQAAREKSFTVDDAALQARIDNLSNQLGGQQALLDWMAAHGFDEAGFRLALRRSLEAAWMRDQITAGVGTTAEQVHARQILLYNLDQANQVYSQLQSGNDFAAMAADFDPQTQGDLGWFPRGYLTQPTLDEAAFSLEPGQYSQVIETELGFHILQVIEKDSQRNLTPDARLKLQVLAIQEWLSQHRSQSTIEVLLP
jgi:peptidyl-prolyl cis-trans isomerase C